MRITPETLTWPFQDPEWKNKFIIGSALALASTVLPLIGLLGLFAVYGYAMIIMRASLRGESPSLPKWENLGEMTADGLKATLSALGYFVPGILSFCCAYGFLFTSIFASAGMSRSSSPAGVFGIVAGQLGYFVLLFLAFVLLYIGFIPMPLANAQYARTSQVSAGYRLGEIWRILRANPVGFLLAWAIYLGLMTALTYLLMFVYLSIILCLLLPVFMAPVTFYLALLWAQLFGMAYRQAIAKIPGLETSAA